MRRCTIPSMLVVLVAMSCGLVACGDGGPAAGAAGGTGGRGGTGGAAGMGGRGSGGAAGSAGAAGGGGPADAAAGGASGTGSVDASVEGGRLDAPPDSSILADAPSVDILSIPDTSQMPDVGASLDSSTPADATVGGAVVVVQDCAEVSCARLFAVAGPCNGDESACMAQVLMTDPDLKTNYCHANGVRKSSTTTSTASGYRTVMTVSKNGGQCYTLEMVGSAGGTENWTFRAPSGEELGRAVSTMNGSKLVLSCDGRNYDVSAVGCPGTDGEPGMGDCAMGSCP